MTEGAVQPGSDRSQVNIHLWSDFTRRIIAVVLLSGMLAGATLTIISIVRQKAARASALSLRSKTLLRSMGRASFAPVLLEDKAALDVILDGFIHEMDVVHVAVYSAEGKVLSQRPADAALPLDLGALDPLAEISERKFTRRRAAPVRDLVLPLRYAAVGGQSSGGEKGEVSGYARIGVTEERFVREMRDTIRYGLIFSVAVTLTAFLLATLLIRRMTARMRDFIAQVQATAELERSNKELEAFSYSVSHDLRAPLRSIDGFSHALLEDYHDRLDDQGKDYLKRVRAACQRMGQLIDDLLGLSKVIRQELRLENVNLSDVARSIAQTLALAHPERPVDFHAQADVQVRGDAGLLRIALENLLGNAWKFSQKTPNPRVEFGVEDRDGARTFFVKDNGAGFDMTYVDKLFGAFQRLHETKEFPGTGIGLATVHRIISRHGGKIWAEAEVGKGARFYFQLPTRTF